MTVKFPTYLALWFLMLCLFPSSVNAQSSVAREWNEALLLAIRNDFARPTVHARNLFHVSAAMYDIWAVYSKKGKSYFLGQTHGGISIPFDGVPDPVDRLSAQEIGISYVAYRLIRFRFRNSPGWERIYHHVDSLMSAKGLDMTFFDEEYQSGNPASLGNYLASRIIDFGLQDGSNEGGGFQNLEYKPLNEPLLLSEPGVGALEYPNRWQPLTFETFVDQSGNQMAAGTPPFLSAEWGNLIPFSLIEDDLTVHEVNGRICRVYHDPGPPVMLEDKQQEMNEAYIWNFQLVVNWSAHLDHEDGIMWDISPRSMGNFSEDDFPFTQDAYQQFYDPFEAGKIVGSGYTQNPYTGRPYEPQIVPRGDYTRVLAEFWADGPDSETPPGHWFSIFNYVSDHPEFQRRMEGKGKELDPLEWEVKGYFTMGGAMHDAAIAAWSTKGYYDYVRPISAFRYMAKMGQSSDDTLANFHPHGVKLQEGWVELVRDDDPLAGKNGEHIGKVKVKAWRGHGFISTTEDIGGVDWVLAENWWPYQRPTFVTPPFAGYVSGHSTFSRAAARIMAILTGDEFFPGGLAEFHAGKNEFLVFERGPSTDVILQWARYVDASDQCSLSRIWGGIHPPIDDIPGRVIGEKVGKSAFYHAKTYFEDVVLSNFPRSEKVGVKVYPNPINAGGSLWLKLPDQSKPYQVSLISASGKPISVFTIDPMTQNEWEIQNLNISPGIYFLKINDGIEQWREKILVR